MGDPMLVLKSSALTVFLAFCLFAAGLASRFDASAGPSLPGPFVSLIFSRTEITAADNCVPRSTGIARLDTQVAPYLKSHGMAATGTLTTGLIMQSTDMCEHFDSSMLGSWDDATRLANRYGWTFVSHTSTYPLGDLNSLSPAQSRAETCGSADTIVAHGLPGAHGFIAYPGKDGAPSSLQEDYADKCFAWGRHYAPKGMTRMSAGTKSPYWQHTRAANGGPCNRPTAACYTVNVKYGYWTRYTLPSELIGYVKGLMPGWWFALQAFILVKGRSPAYSTSKAAWDCTSPNPALHWSDDNERYCWVDYKAIIRAIAAKRVTVTDPLRVGIAFGRPAKYPK